MLIDSRIISAFVFALISFLILLEFSIAFDTIVKSQSLSDGETWESSGQSFELGSFSPGKSKNMV